MYVTSATIAKTIADIGASNWDKTLADNMWERLEAMTDKTRAQQQEWERVATQQHFHAGRGQAYWEGAYLVLKLLSGRDLKVDEMQP
jgi:hypothetical protein